MSPTSSYFQDFQNQDFFVLIHRLYSKSDQLFHNLQYLNKKVNWYNQDGNKTAIYDYKNIIHRIGAGIIIGKNCGIELLLENEVSNLKPEIENENIVSYKDEETNSTILSLDYDSRDDALLTKSGALIKLNISNSTYNQNTYQSLDFDFDIYSLLHGRKHTPIIFL